MPPRIVIARPLPGDPVARFLAAGLDDLWINLRDEKLTPEALLSAVPGAHAILPTPADRIDGTVMDAAGSQLVIVSNYAVGVDNVDLDAAKQRGVIVGHTPDAVTEPTADIAWLLLLGAAKRATEANDLIRSGQWKGVAPNLLLGARVYEKTLLIIGPGRIGHATARRAPGWKMNVLYHGRSPHPEFECEPINAKRVTLEEGLAQADFISIHTPLNDETRHLINAERLAMMKPTAILINTSRGAVVDEAALVDALRDGTIAAAGLDVFEREPQVHPGLLELPNAYLQPHMGSATVEDREWMMRLAVDNAIAALQGEAVPHRVV